MKCFIGLPAAKEAEPHLCELQKRAFSLDPASRIIPAENFHVTLAFIGEITPEQAQLVAQGVDIMTDFSSRSWRITRSGRFVRPKVFYVSGERYEPIFHLAREAAEILHTLNIPFDEKSRFTPHITVLRNSHLDEPVVTHPFEWPILRARLFESKLDEDGKRVYVPI